MEGNNEKKNKKRNRDGYNKNYYAENRDRILEKKRGRYHEDAGYREQCKAQARERRMEHKENREDPMIEVGGIRSAAFPVRVLSERIGKSVSTINHWQRTGTIPATPFYSGGGHRLYTEGMIVVVFRALSVFPFPKTGSEDFFNAVKYGWSRIGVIT